MMREPLPASDRARQSGMTLIEILVAIVVLSVGLLGLAGLQLKGLQVGQGSTYRWQAAVLAQDMADRMRADRTNVCLYALPGGTPAAGTATAQSIADWQARVAALPSGIATITFPSCPAANPLPQGVTIQIQWDDTRATRGAGQSVSNTIAIPGTFLLTTDL